jgi:hypothetical protein
MARLKDERAAFRKRLLLVVSRGTTVSRVCAFTDPVDTGQNVLPFIQDQSALPGRRLEPSTGLTTLQYRPGFEQADGFGSSQKRDGLRLALLTFGNPFVQCVKAGNNFFIVHIKPRTATTALVVERSEAAILSPPATSPAFER